ncbi:MAG TPA: hypothetical protein VNE63_12360 [Candidatus Acidoferrales bacterium]|nr:hypothetical protein [Candidatus Acidoferrales bacterium]
MQNDAVKLAVWPSATLAVEGEIEFVAAHVMVTVALADSELSVTLMAVTVTVAGEGGTAGAVYNAVVVLLEATIPVAGLPPATPFTLHTTADEAVPAPVTLAVNASPPSAGTVAVVGEIPTTILPGALTLGEEGEDVAIPPQPISAHRIRHEVARKTNCIRLFSSRPMKPAHRPTCG